jgi:hypothetical protein
MSRHRHLAPVRTMSPTRGARWYATLAPIAPARQQRSRQRGLPARPGQRSQRGAHVGAGPAPAATTFAAAWNGKRSSSPRSRSASDPFRGRPRTSAATTRINRRETGDGAGRTACQTLATSASVLTNTSSPRSVRLTSPRACRTLSAREDSTCSRRRSINRTGTAGVAAPQTRRDRTAAARTRPPLP